MTLVRCFALLFLLALISTGGGAEPSPDAMDDNPRNADSRRTIAFTEDSLAVVKKKVADGAAVLIDVRSQKEWNQGHLEGSIFVPVTSLQKNSLDPAKLEKTLPKKADKKILYTFCVVGMRAKQAGIVLENQGYTVRVLKPGYEDLVKAGFKKAESKGKE